MNNLLTPTPLKGGEKTPHISCLYERPVYGMKRISRSLTRDSFEHVDQDFRVGYFQGESGAYRFGPLPRCGNGIAIR
jgi:hypothetical protein